MVLPVFCSLNGSRGVNKTALNQATEVEISSMVLPVFCSLNGSRGVNKNALNQGY